MRTLLFCLPTLLFYLLPQSLHAQKRTAYNLWNRQAILESPQYTRKDSMYIRVGLKGKKLPWFIWNAEVWQGNERLGSMIYFRKFPRSRRIRIRKPTDMEGPIVVVTRGDLQVNGKEHYGVREFMYWKNRVLYVPIEHRSNIPD
ncbi:MAG: hypothetical protein AAF570_18740 [Bacteroidota bacterium]